MAKKVVGIVKVRIPGGEATPAPPLGPALGQKQIQIAAFVKDFNAKTSKMKGQLLNTYIIVYEDKTYTFVTKGTSTSTLIPIARAVPATIFFASSISLADI